jgi:hypothetical protein
MGKDKSGRCKRQGDSGVVMMAAVVEDCGGGRRQRRRTMIAADDNGMQDWAAYYKGDGQERAARDGGDTEWQ